MSSMVSGLLVVCLWGADPASIPRPQGHDAQPRPSSQAALSQAALEALVTGVALYPDPLLNHILDAAQHPAELRQAAMALDLDDEVDP
ncbi:MAG TPA: DUF3300 domain-containing protein, partial [Planctomycetaceae bacterium]|nr:DUF3300 domain-containing protein [Planctomycetaceae bacterium]